MASTKNKEHTPQLTRWAALTTPPAAFLCNEKFRKWITVLRAISRRVVASI
jgi:hypothetical protein